MLIPNTSATPHTSSSSDTSVSTPRDTCIPTLYGLNSQRRSLLASCAVNFERFTARRLSHIPGIVKLQESPGKAGGLLRGIYLGFAFEGYLWGVGTLPLLSRSLLGVGGILSAFPDVTTTLIGIGILLMMHAICLVLARRKTVAVTKSKV